MSQLGWYNSYLRHKLKSVYLNSDEFKRLRGVYSSAPGPTPWHHSSLPPFLGSNDLELRWKRSDSKANPMVVVLGNQERQLNFLAVGGYCYILPLSNERLCLWHRDHNLHLIMIDTRSLKPLTTIPNLEERRKMGQSPLEFVSGLVAETEFPIPDKTGKFPFRFPDPMRSVNELLVLGFVVAHRPRNSAIYVVKPSENTVEVLPMDWWNDGDNDFGYEWITKIARDPQTGNIVGEGVRILPFLLDQSGRFLGWMEEGTNKSQ